jgi:hypothetical protein
MKEIAMFFIFDSALCSGAEATEATDPGQETAHPLPAPILETLVSRPHSMAPPHSDAREASSKPGCADRLG